MELTAGTLVADRFRLVRKLGEGGMGSVWLAHHEKLETSCAVKFISADVASATGVRERFEREAKIAAQIKSPHVVHVLDYGVSDGTPYIAMEYLEGEDLAHRLAARGRLSPAETLAVVSQIARALTKAHAAGLVHRDLKPENVFLVPDDDRELVKVLDFGIAKAQTPMPDGGTRTGVMMGTPRFMSPEQAQGLKTLDYRSDLWSLGVIAYRCIVGTLPFDSEAMGDLMMRIIVHPLPVPSQVAPGVPPTFDVWWTRAAARDPAHRFQSAKELADTLSTAFALSLSTSGAVAVSSSGVDGSAPMRAQHGSSSPGLVSSPAITPIHGSSLSPTMVGAPTILPATATSIPGRTPPDRTMSTASRTFVGDTPPRKSPAAIFAVAGGITFAAIGIAAVVFLRGKPADGPVVPVSAAPMVTQTAPSASKPLVEPEPTPSAQEVPSASTPSPSAAPAKPTVLRPKPVQTTPPPPVRTGKVRIVPPG